MSTFDGDMEDLKALGHSALSLVTMGIMLAIVAVILASKAMPQLVLTMFQFLAWLVGQVISPLKPGQVVQLGTAYGGAGAFPTAVGGVGGSGAPGTTAVPGSTGTTGGTGTGGTSGDGFIDSGTFDTGGPAGAPPGTGTGTSGTPQQWWGIGPNGNRLGLTTDPQNFPVPGATSYQPSVAGS